MAQNEASIQSRAEMGGRRVAFLFRNPSGEARAALADRRGLPTPLEQIAVAAQPTAGPGPPQAPPFPEEPPVTPLEIPGGGGGGLARVLPAF